MGADELIQQAEEALRSGRAEEALSLVARALEQGASRVAGLRVQASALVRLGRTSQAEPVLNELIDLRPDDPWAYAELARLQLAAGRMAKAEALLGRAVQLAPTDPTLRSDLERVRQMGTTRGQQENKRSALVWVITGVVALALIGALVLWATGVLGKPAEPPVQAAVPQPAPEPPVTQPMPEPPPQPAVAQTIPEPAAEPPVNEAPPPLPPAPKVVTVPAEPPPPPPPPPPPKEPTARVLWLRCQEVPQLEFRGEGRVRRVYQMWGEVLNESDQPLPVAVVRGVLLYGNQAAGYGLSEVQNVPPRGRAAFNFYAYQLGLEGAAKPNAYDAMVIPGFQISQAFKDLGAYGTMLEQLLMGSGGM